MMSASPFPKIFRHPSTLPPHPQYFSSLSQQPLSQQFDSTFERHPPYQLLSHTPIPNENFNQNLIDQQFQAYFAQASGACMSNPSIDITSAAPLPPPDSTFESSGVASVPTPFEWMYRSNMGDSVSARPVKRARTHQRTPSCSTIASNGPSSPHSANISYPQIANTDYSPNSPSLYADQAFAKSFPSDGLASVGPYMPSIASHAQNAHLAMNGFTIDPQNTDDLPDFVQSSRRSMSSRGNNSPATPHSGVGYVENSESKAANDSSQGELMSLDLDMMNDGLLFVEPDYRQNNPNVQLFRTESSQAYQDELFNPPTLFNSVPMPAAKQQPKYLSPHQNLVTERLQKADMARSASPTSAMSRELSPFRDGSPHAPAADWRHNGSKLGTAASIRQAQKAETDSVELAQRFPQLHREPTNTISPKDAVLDYTETDQQPLFQDTLPAGYKQHTSGPDSWQNDFVPQSGSTFGNLTAPASQQQMAPFRATSANGLVHQNFGGLMSLPPDHGSQTQIQGTPLQNSPYNAPKMNFSDSNPEFPASFLTMETSVSEAGLPLSSQESMNITSAPQRPADVRANTGPFTCPYHGCPQRFDSCNHLINHKRNFHRSQQSSRDDQSTGTGSASARSTESPAPSSAGGMTSAAILARNSQAGPHKCTRINPSTNKPCNTIFSRPYDLTRHEDTIHNNRKQKVRCSMCREEKTFSRNDALTRHMRVVHPEIETFGKRGRRGD